MEERVPPVSSTRLPSPPVPPPTFKPPEREPTPVMAPPVDEEDGEDIDQCCACGDVVYRSCAYICQTLTRDGDHYVPCDHPVCTNCFEPGQTECTCAHESPPPGLGLSSAPTPPQPPTATDPTMTTMASAISHLVNLQDTMGKAVTAALGRGSGDGNRSTLKTVHMLEFEKGSEVALEDLERWLVEFHRVVDHVSGGHGLPFKTLIVHLRACWTNTLPGDAGRAGENIRLD